MPRHPERTAMELAIEQMASSNRKSFWTKQDVVAAFIKRTPGKSEELKILAELDQRVQADLVPTLFKNDKPLARVHQERELERLKRLAGEVMRLWKEEEYGLHRRFGSWRATPTKGKSEWRWFEVRYASVSHLRLWRDLKEEHKTRVGITIDETDVILSLARERQAQTVNKVYREAMLAIAARRGSRAA